MAEKSSEDEDEFDMNDSELNLEDEDEDDDVDIEDSDDYDLTIDETPKRSMYLTDQKKSRKLSSRVTPFMLFAKKNRPKIQESLPGLSFDALTAKLEEKWASLPSSEKSMWKRKLNQISKSSPTPNQPTLVKIVAQPPLSGGRILLTPDHQMTHSFGTYRVTGTEPIDAAAHLKLLGESLSVIGQRLSGSVGSIAVSGSLSVLLDSLLCAMGPLVCLTKQVPQLQDAVPQEKLNKILDNIAYVMPGL